MNVNTQSMLANLEGLKPAHIFRAAADILEDKAIPGFRSFRSDGWAVVIGNMKFAHRHLIAQALYVQTGIKTDPSHFEGNGAEFKAVFVDRFGLKVTE